MIEIHPNLNPLEVILVNEELERRGIRSYTLLPGNDCIWAHYNLVNEYYIFRDGRLVDIQVD
jgi:type VI protein secretion system component VasA